MKLAIVLLALSLAVMTVMIVKAGLQELTVRRMKTHTAEDTAAIKRKEDAILVVKTQIRELKTVLASVDHNVEELKKKKAENEVSEKEAEKSLSTCKTEKADVEKKKTDMLEAAAKLAAGHQEEKMKAAVDIQELKQQILDRDTAVCAFADQTIEEARKLCRIPADTR